MSYEEKIEKYKSDWILLDNFFKLDKRLQKRVLVERWQLDYSIDKQHQCLLKKKKRKIKCQQDLLIIYLWILILVLLDKWHMDHNILLLEYLHMMDVRLNYIFLVMLYVQINVVTNINNNYLILNMHNT